MREFVLDLLRRHLSSDLRISGGTNVITKCPFHKGGEERKPSFSVNIDKGVFNCFTCHEAGSITTLLHLLRVPRSIIDAEMRILGPHMEHARELYKLQKTITFTRKNPFAADFVLPEEILGIYEWCPVSLVNDGFDPALLQKMEVGFDRARNRIMYPIRDMYGSLAGFSGGSVVGEMPKYLVYQGRRQDLNGRWRPSDYGQWFDDNGEFSGYTCENHDFLWNFERVMPRILAEDSKDSVVYVVEGFKACLWMLQNGFHNTVGLMGSYISDRQQQMLHRLGCTIVLCLDNDKPGRKASFNVGNILWGPMYGRVKVMIYPPEDVDTQPDDYDGPYLAQLVNSAVPFTSYLNKLRQDGAL